MLWLFLVACAVVMSWLGVHHSVCGTMVQAGVVHRNVRRSKQPIKFQDRLNNDVEDLIAQGTNYQLYNREGVGEFRVIQIHLRKAGGRTLECTFSGGGREDTFSFLAHPPFSDVRSKINFGHEWRWTGAQLRRAVNSHSSIVVATIRHPLKRLLSALRTSTGRQSCDMKKVVPTLAQVPKHNSTSNIMNVDKMNKSFGEDARLDKIRGDREEQGSPQCCLVGHLVACDEAVSLIRHREMTPEALASMRTMDLSMNYQVKMLSLMPKVAEEEALFIPQNDSEQTLMVQKAVDFLKQFVEVTIIVDRFAQSMGVLSCAIEEKSGHKLQNIHSCSNYNPDKEAHREGGAHTMDGLDDVTRRKLEEKNRADMQLFEWVNAKLDADVAKYQQKNCYTRTIVALQRCVKDREQNLKYVYKRNYHIVGKDPQEVFNKIPSKTKRESKSISELIVEQHTCYIDTKT
eukprot:m.18076 g.18076  ORF g.18076 m.18076 type:complete len:458 (-) comp4896_c0_seq1:211-1584(-)